MTFDLSGYVEVAERIRAFYARFPSGSIRTELVRLDDELVIFKALVYRDAADPVPTTGWAHDRIGPDPAGAEHRVESCEASAVGRALANRDFAGGRRPSREEMAKVQRLRRDARGRGRGGGAGAGEADGGGAGSSPEERIRRLAGQVRLPRAKRERIEAKLRAGMTSQELHELEAYLLALRARAP